MLCTYITPLPDAVTPRRAAESLRAVLAFQGLDSALESQPRVDAPHAGDILHVFVCASNGRTPGDRTLAGSFFAPARQPGVWRVGPISLAAIAHAVRPADLAGPRAEGLLVAIQRDLCDLDGHQLRHLADSLDAADAILAATPSPQLERAWLSTLAYLARVAAGERASEGDAQ